MKRAREPRDSQKYVLFLMLWVADWWKHLQAAVTVYVHDAVEREFTLKMKGLRDRDKRHQGMAVTNGGSLGL